VVDRTVILEAVVHRTQWVGKCWAQIPECSSELVHRVSQLLAKVDRWKSLADKMFGWLLDQRVVQLTMEDCSFEECHLQERMKMLKIF